ncbi:MAG: hypothetical protein QW298_02355 [Candidatus Micrarchaeaceae archaeon]
MLSANESNNTKTKIVFDGFFENIQFQFQVEYQYGQLKPIELREALQDYLYSIQGELFDQISANTWEFRTDFFKRYFILKTGEVKKTIVNVEKNNDEYIYIDVILPDNTKNPFELAKKSVELFLKLLP